MAVFRGRIEAFVQRGEVAGNCDLPAAAFCAEPEITANRRPGEKSMTLRPVRRRNWLSSFVSVYWGSPGRASGPRLVQPPQSGVEANWGSRTP